MIKLDNKTLVRWLVISAVVVVVMLALSVWGATRPGLGEEVCTHWNAAGVCDGWGGKFLGFYLLPLVMIGVVGLIAAIPFIEPRRSNLAMSRTAYVALWAVLLFYFLVLHVILVINALHEAGVVAFNLDVGRLVPISVGVLFVVIGNYLGKIRSNYMMGIRTPWTLASDLAWDKTHRLGGKLFMLAGLLLVLSSLFLPVTWWVYVMLGTLFPMIIFLFVYSYLVWRNDPKAHNGITGNAG